jgi:hypothetical protein
MRSRVFLRADFVLFCQIRNVGMLAFLLGVIMTRSTAA